MSKKDIYKQLGWSDELITEVGKIAKLIEKSAINEDLNTYSRMDITGNHDSSSYTCNPKQLVRGSSKISI